MRTEPDGDVFTFIDLERVAFQRLSEFVSRAGPPRGDEPGAE